MDGTSPFAAARVWQFSGGILAEFGKITGRLLNWALHAAAGIVIAIVAPEFLPEAIGSLSGRCALDLIGQLMHAQGSAIARSRSLRGACWISRGG